MFSYVPKQDLGRDPESIFTGKSVIAAILVCVLAGFVFPYFFRSKNMAKNKNRYTSSLKMNNEDEFRLKTSVGDISFKVYGNGDDWEIVGDFSSVKLPITVNNKLEILINGNPTSIWVSNGKEISYPIVVRDKYFHWRCSKVITELENGIELIFEKNFIAGSEYNVCRLSYPR